jgi:ASC-1-like (ASCH) protein
MIHNMYEHFLKKYKNNKKRILLLIRLILYKTISIGNTISFYIKQLRIKFKNIKIFSFF